MKLETIYLTRTGYGPTPDQITGKVKVSTQSGEIELKLSPEHIRGVLALVADALVAQTRELATEMTTEVIEHAGQPMLLETPGS